MLLSEIASPEITRNDVAQTYLLAMLSDEEVDWRTVNMAIIKRWSISTLQYIKERAWAKLDEIKCNRNGRFEAMKQDECRGCK